MQNLDILNEYITAKWIDPPVQPKLKIYVFNFTNPEEFLNGAKPKLREVGPYVFQEEWYKDNVKWKNATEVIQHASRKLSS